MCIFDQKQNKCSKRLSIKQFAVLIDLLQFSYSPSYLYVCISVHLRTRDGLHMPLTVRQFSYEESDAKREKREINCLLLVLLLSNYER